MRRLSMVASVVALCSAGFYGVAYADDEDGSEGCGRSAQSSYAGYESEDSRDDSSSESDDADDSDHCYQVSHRSRGGKGGEPGDNSVFCGSDLTASGPVKNCQTSRAQRGADG